MKNSSVFMDQSDEGKFTIQDVNTHSKPKFFRRF